MGIGLTIVVTIILWLVVLVWLRSLIVRRLAPERILRDLRDEVAQLTREINRVGDQNTSLVEDRITTLKSLLNRAENLIDEAQVLLRRLEAHKDIAVPPPVANTEETVPVSEYIKTETVDGESPRLSVERLHRQGLGSEIIANRLGIAIGEVELMISLLEQRIR